MNPEIRVEIRRHVTEPETANLSTAIQVLKQRFSRTRSEEFVWEPRYHDFNVFTDAKRVEKLRYMHRNPIKAGLVELPEQWRWSSYRAYASQEDHPVQITTQHPKTPSIAFTWRNSAATS